MQYIVHQLRHGSYMLEPHIASMVKSADFEQAVRNISGDEDGKARLMIDALKGISLDPRQGNQPEAFSKIYGRMACFNIRFDRWVNFIGVIELPVGDVRATHLINAIKTNLESRMFKAAGMHRRLDQRRKALFSQAARESAAQLNAMREQNGGAFPDREAYDQARAICGQGIDQRMARVDVRIRRVADAASPEFNGSYMEMLARFLYWHLPYGAH